MYRVFITERAERDIDEISTWWAENRSRQQAQRWYNGIAAAIRSLADDPERHSLAYETENYSYELRQLNYGLGRRPTHRVVFTISVDVVQVLRVRHLAQDLLSPNDL